jgi:alanine racemase
VTCQFDEDVRRLSSATHAVIDLERYASNVSVLLSMVSAGTELMAVVKADGYGHGAVECGRAAILAGASMLGVARTSEALYLRSQGLTCPIVVIGPPTPGEMKAAIEQGVALTIGSRFAEEALADAVSSGKMMAKVHLKVDTGMRRYGYVPVDASAAAARLVRMSRVHLEGAFTHFSSADETDPAPTILQLERLLAVVRQCRRDGVDPRYVHAANSAAVLAGHTEGTNLVRCGIATYGLSPSSDVPVDDRFAPVMMLKSAVARVQAAPAGAGVSYGQTYRAVEGERLGAVPFGYADGMPRQVSNRGWVVVGGERATIRGRVCMDQTVVSLPGGAQEGDNVVVIGTEQEGAMTIDDVARLAGTNNYEVATRLMARVPRLYVRDGGVVAWEHVLSGTRGRQDSRMTDANQGATRRPV